MLTKDDLQAIGALIKAETEPINKKLDEVAQAQDQTQTGLEAVRAGLEDVQAKQKEQATKQDVEVTVEAAKADLKVELASKADMLDLGAKIDKNTKSYKIRLEELEKDAGIRNRDKN